MTSLVAYNPDDPAQAGFLAALAQGETGGAANSAFTGTGGANLSGLATDQYGFPSWSGLGNSHAAGTYQFQPGTWDAIASQFNLNFQNPQDQAEGAWYLAQQTYANQNSGASLETALNTPSQYGTIQSSLKNVWTSVVGNQSNPTGLASSLGSFIGNATSAGSASPSAANTTAGSSGTAASGGFATTVANWLNTLTGQPQVTTATAGLPGTSGSGGSLFARGGTVAVGVVIVMVAVYALLVQQNIAPSPREIVRAV